MSDPVRLRNVGPDVLSFEDRGSVRDVPSGDEFTTDPRTATILMRVARVELVPQPEAPAPVPSPLIIPVGARTAGRA